MREINLQSSETSVHKNRQYFIAFKGRMFYYNHDRLSGVFPMYSKNQLLTIKAFFTPTS